MTKLIKQDDGTVVGKVIGGVPKNVKEEFDIEVVDDANGFEVDQSGLSASEKELLTDVYPVQ